MSCVQIRKGNGEWAVGCGEHGVGVVCGVWGAVCRIADSRVICDSPRGRGFDPCHGGFSVVIPSLSVTRLGACGNSKAALQQDHITVSHRAVSVFMQSLQCQG